MADGEGFVGRCEVVAPRRGNRRWPDAVKARIVAESLEPGVGVADVACRHDLVAHQLLATTSTSGSSGAASGTDDGRAAL